MTDGNRHAPKILLNSNAGSRVASPAGTRVNSPTRNLKIASDQVTNEFLKNTKPAYKDIHINLNDPSIIPYNSKNKLDHCVSFDTVAINYSENNGGGVITEEDYDEDDLIARRNHINDIPRGRSSSPYARGRSPSSSPFRARSPSPDEDFRISMANIDRLPSKGHFDGSGWRIDYPSISAIRNDSFTRTLRHPDYKDYIKENNKRTLIVYITGRQHTWISLDYVIAKLLRDGDHLVVISRTPASYTAEIIKRGNRHEIYNDEIDPKIFRNACANIEKYIYAIMDPKIKFQLTVDLFLSDSTCDVLNESVDIYEPNMIITTTKPNLRFQRVTTWKTSRISDRLVKNFDIPILVVPAFTSNQFELDFFAKFKTKEAKESDANDQEIEKEGEADEELKLAAEEVQDATKLLSTPELPNTSPRFSNNDGSMTSDVSSTISSDEESSDDDDSTSSLLELTKTITSYNEILDQFAEETDEVPINETIFLEKLNKVSDISKRMAKKFQSFTENEGEGGDLVRTLTGLPKLEKHKSMLDVLSVQDDTGAEAVNHLKRTLQNLPISQPDGTHIKLSDSGSATPRTIKFTDPPSGGLISQKQKHENVDSLRRFKTNVEPPQTRTRRNSMDLKPSRSQPGHLIKSVSESQVRLSNSDQDGGQSSGKKKRGFLKSWFRK